MDKDGNDDDDDDDEDKDEKTKKSESSSSSWDVVSCCIFIRPIDCDDCTVTFLGHCNMFCFYIIHDLTSFKDFHEPCMRQLECLVESIFISD